MATLFSQAITAMCINAANGQYNDACNKAMTAGTMQLGYKQEVDSAEDKARTILIAKTQDILGKDLIVIGGSTAFAYHIIKTKSVSFKIPNLGICNSINNELTSNSYKLTMQWKLK